MKPQSEAYEPLAQYFEGTAKDSRDASSDELKYFIRPVEPTKQVEPTEPNKYMREILPGVWVDVYDVLQAWKVTNPALQHLIKKALQPGHRGHKTLEEDLNDIASSAKRAIRLEKNKENYAKDNS